MNPTMLLCEYKENPLGIQSQCPAFSWSLQDIEGAAKQVSYQLLVASSPEKLSQNEADVWDSGEVASSATVCEYAGKVKLQSCTRYFWKVRVRCGAQWSEFGDAAEFEMALLDVKLWKGQWIGMPNDSKAVGLFRTEKFLVGKVSRARIYLASDGYVQLWINGNRVGQELLNPANSDHSKHVFYSTYDVTSFLKTGGNAIGVEMACGWATHPKFLMQGFIEMESGEVISLESGFSNWVFLISPILSATIYSGEVCNANYERPEWCVYGNEFHERNHKYYWGIFSDSLPVKRSDNESQYKEYAHAYYDVMELPAPKGKLVAQMLEPIREVDRLKPLRILKMPNGGQIVDFGQNFAGTVRIKLSGKQYASVKLQYSEILNDDNTLNMEYLRVSDPSYPLPMQCDQYILKGLKEEIYQPTFTYHGFRYVSIEGDIAEISADDIEGVVIHSAVRPSGRFQCSNKLINKIHENIVWTERSNLYSIPTDCCQRSERQGWLNDLTARAEASLFNFNLNLFYEKFTQDIADTQDPVSGAIADTAPFRRGNYPADPVSSSFLILCDLLYTHYGNVRPIREHYESMRKWTEFLRSISRDNIVTFSIYGDWASPIDQCMHNGYVSPVSNITPGYYISTGYYYLDLKLMRKFALLLGKNDDAAHFDKLIEDVKQTLLAKFRDPVTKGYAGGSQGSNVFALYLEIVPEDEIPTVVDLIAADIEKHDFHLTTGNLMTKYLPEMLTKYGRVDVALRLVTQTTYPSWGYMVEKGATTIWERWEYETGYGMNSHNHPMYGSINAWFFCYLAGITPLAANYSRIRIRPYLPAQLDYVTAGVETYAGTVACEWKKHQDGVSFDLTLPNGTETEFYAPISEKTQSITCGDRVVWSQDDNAERDDAIRVISEEADFVCFGLPGGKYHFCVK